MNTRDPLELEHFNKLSATWWDEAGPFQLLHRMTPLRMAFLLERATSYFDLPENSPTPLQGLRILDVGCGGGLLCEPLARLGADVVGIDPVEDHLSVARAHAEAIGLSISYLPCAIEDLPSDLEGFDLVVASEIIEHVVDVDGFLHACAEKVGDHGALMVTTLNQTLKSYVFGILAAEYLLKWAPPGTHAWDKFLPPPILSRKLKALGLTTQYTQGVRLSPLSKTWHFSSSMDINYFLWGQKGN